jgi:oxygen-independent coproporphyrinogen III oxidase
VRGGNIADLEAWRAHLVRGERVTEDRVVLTPALLVEDALIFGMRMNAGVDLAVLRERFPEAPWTAVETEAVRLVEHGMAERSGAILRLTPRGRLMADAVGAELMNAFTETV